MTIKIIDLYSGNNFEPDKIIADGYIGVIFKAGQGGWADCPRYHPEWWMQAKDAGLLVGWYWLCDSRYHSSKHIREMEEWKIFDDVGNLGLWIDMEKPVLSMTETAYWKTPYAGYRNVVDFTYLINDRGVKPGIYTGPGAYELIMRGAPETAHDYLGEHELWTAQYPYIYIPYVSNPKMYGSWKIWALWQYREGPDVNIFNGSDDQFYMKYGGYLSPEPPPPPITGETMPTQKGTARTATNIKSMSGVPSGTIATLPVGGWVYGNYNPARTDLVDVTEYFRPTGEKIALSVPCKVSVINLTVTPYSVVIPPDPTPDPTPAPIDVHVNVDSLGVVTVAVNGADYVKAQ